MAKDDKDTKKPQLPGGLQVAPAGMLEELSSADGDSDALAQPADEVGDQGEAPAHLGAVKYVHAAFFAGGMLAAYLSGKLLGSLWNSLAEWPAAVRTVPALLRFAEDERGSITMLLGAVIGVIAVVQTYRKEHIRRFADEVAIELSKATWPDKEMVTNGTIVVLVASAVAAAYIALLDRLWSFATALIYRV